ncbi:hypothetical protein Taro_006677 [Colocasia esculenta]|uniref:Uncharacterized protein n=1 Tax=Colocasia esculenta TaxID=4460 RepID=A0A843TXN8_COLES|nr:hypothetical protein [Colocasia esculenta]
MEHQDDPPDRSVVGEHAPTDAQPQHVDQQGLLRRLPSPAPAFTITGSTIHHHLLRSLPTASNVSASDSTTSTLFEGASLSLSLPLLSVEEASPTSLLPPSGLPAPSLPLSSVEEASPTSLLPLSGLPAPSLSHSLVSQSLPLPPFLTISSEGPEGLWPPCSRFSLPPSLSHSLISQSLSLHPFLTLSSPRAQRASGLPAPSLPLSLSRLPVPLPPSVSHSLISWRVSGLPVPSLPLSLSSLPIPLAPSLSHSFISMRASGLPALPTPTLPLSLSRLPVGPVPFPPSLSSPVKEIVGPFGVAARQEDSPLLF